MYNHGTGNEYFMTAFFAMFIFAGVFNSFNARTARLRLLTHIWKNKGFMSIMLFVTVIQLLIIYCGGSIFRTTGLTYSELQFVLILSITVIPVDFIRKILLGTSLARQCDLNDPASIRINIKTACGINNIPQAV